ncbi:MAG: glycosyltransferase family 4 protein [Fischerella sp. CENA71]|nr:glycosyltransferase family 4 protein [Fischerella sp. CENA71]
MTLSKWINQKLFLSNSINSDSLDAKSEQLLKTGKMIKLSVMTQFFPPDYAATGQLLEELTRQLGYLGVDIEVFTSQPGYAFKSSHAPSIQELGKVLVQRSRTAQLWPGRIRGKAVNGVLFTLRAALHLLKNGRRFNLLLLTTAPPFLPILGYLAHTWFRLPYVCILYDLYPDIAIALNVISKDHWIAKLWRKLNKLVWQKSKAIIVLSPAMKMRVATICPQVEDKIFVIHSWGDPDLIVPIAKQENWFAWKHNLVNKFSVVYSGNMGRCHDMDTILETAKLLQDEPIQFVFIGSGAKKEEVIKEVNRLGLQKNFVFLPYQDKEVLPYSLTAGDLSLVSVDEGMESLVAPSKLYPALATGRPVAVICSEYSYLRQMITQANCGDTFENGDSHGLAEFIRLLSQDRELAKRMGKAGRQYMRSHYTSEIISRQYLDVLLRSIN